MRSGERVRVVRRPKPRWSPPRRDLALFTVKCNGRDQDQASRTRPWHPGSLRWAGSGGGRRRGGRRVPGRDGRRRGAAGGRSNRDCRALPPCPSVPVAANPLEWAAGSRVERHTVGAHETGRPTFGPGAVRGEGPSAPVLTKAHSPSSWDTGAGRKRRSQPASPTPRRAPAKGDRVGAASPV